MNISVEVTQELLDYLRIKERSGLYTSRSEVVRDSLRRMMTDDLSLAANGITLSEFKQLRKRAGEEIVKERFPELSQSVSGQ
jgi:Arc/MetJ-type ribon-helix-helix transcriptional regulator